MDFLEPKERSRRMSLIRKTNTRPEIVVRKLAHALGYRFRLHRRSLPGTPDLVFVRLKKVVDVRGCFWHSHCCRRSKPRVATRKHYWWPKLRRNALRDRNNVRRLQRLGWDVLVIWECETRRPHTLAKRLHEFLKIRRRTKRAGGTGG